MRKFMLSALALALMSGATAGAAEQKTPNGGAVNAYGPSGPEQIKPSNQAKQMVKVFKKNGMGAVDKMSPEMRKLVHSNVQKHLKALFAERTAAMRQLGLDPGQSKYLYYFVSTSMPKALIRAYARQAVWTGGVLVFKGVKKDHTIPWFIRNVIGPLTKNKNAHPTVVIDPKLYQAFNVDLVPSIVYTKLQPQQVCQRSHKKTVILKGYGKAPMSVCDQSSTADYWKISGGVSIWYALRQFKSAGAPGIDPLLKAAQMGSLGQSKNLGGLSQKQYVQSPGPGSIQQVTRLLTGGSREQVGANGRVLPLGNFPGSSGITLPSPSEGRKPQ